MTAVQPAVRVLVTGPRDLVTTFVAPALRTHGFAAAAHLAADPLPPVRDDGGWSSSTWTCPSAGLVAAAAGCGWWTIALVRPSDPARAAAAAAAGAAALLPRTASFQDLLDLLGVVVTGVDPMSAVDRGHGSISTVR